MEKRFLDIYLNPQEDKMIKKIFKVIIFFLFYSLLFWPFYVIIIYINFSAKLRFLLSIFMFVLEIILGIICVIWSIFTLKERKTFGSITLFSLTLICFLIYVFSLLNTYVLKLKF